MSIDAALDELVREAARREWEPNGQTIALWRKTLEALFDSSRMVVVCGTIDVGQGTEGLRCTCPAGWAPVASPDCPRHGNRAPAHTVTGPAAAAREVAETLKGLPGEGEVRR